MIAVGRGYLLTHEPELLVRAQAAEVKLTRTLRTIVSTTDAAEERQRLDPLMASAKRYRDTFAVLLSGEKAPREPREVAEAMRKQLIPARDDLVAGLDELVARRLGQLESLRSSARDLESTTLDVMLGLGGLGVVASMLFAWLVVTRARDLGSQRFEPGVAQIRPPDGARVPGPHRLSRRPPSARSRPS